MAKKQVTQGKIAEVLGISRNTVSKALNNGCDVSEQLRQKVRNTAIELGRITDENGFPIKKISMDHKDLERGIHLELLSGGVIFLSTICF